MIDGGRMIILKKKYYIKNFWVLFEKFLNLIFFLKNSLYINWSSNYNILDPKFSDLLFGKSDPWRIESDNAWKLTSSYKLLRASIIDRSVLITSPRSASCGCHCKGADRIGYTNLKAGWNRHTMEDPNSCCGCEAGVSPCIKNPTLISRPISSLSTISADSDRLLPPPPPPSVPLESWREMAAASTALRPLFLPHLPTTATVAVRLHPPPLLLPLRSLRSSLPPSRSRLSPVVFAQSNLFKGSSLTLLSPSSTLFQICATTFVFVFLIRVLLSVYPGVGFGVGKLFLSW